MKMNAEKSQCSLHRNILHLWRTIFFFSVHNIATRICFMLLRSLTSFQGLHFEGLKNVPRSLFAYFFSLFLNYVIYFFIVYFIFFSWDGRLITQTDLAVALVKFRLNIKPSRNRFPYSNISYVRRMFVWRLKRYLCSRLHYY